MRATFNKFLSFGLGYRYKDAVSAMISAEFKNFSWAIPTITDLCHQQGSSSGSHEIVAGYMIKLNFGEKNKNKHRSIRIM